jgi:hypothetical protein
MKQRSFRCNIGECVATPRGAVCEILSLTADSALIRYLGKHRHLGEIELQLALLRPATAHDMVRAGAHYRDPGAALPRRLASSKAIHKTPCEDIHTQTGIAGTSQGSNGSPADAGSVAALDEPISAPMNDYCDQERIARSRRI